jgi:putative ABC transport system permease protein
MWKNYVSVAVRNMFRHKLYFVINILGLSLGIAASIIIYLYLAFELSYDNFYLDYEKIYRVCTDNRGNEDIYISSTTSGPVAQVLKDNYPQISSVAKLLNVGKILFKYEDKEFFEDKTFFADPEIFEVLKPVLLKGDPVTALDEPNSILITESIASKYFGSQNPIGKTLTLNGMEFKVTGVVKNCPLNTHIKYNFLVSMNFLKDRYPFEEWFLFNFHTYVLLKDNINLAEFEQQLNQLAYPYVGEDLEKNGDTLEFFLQPINEIHLNSHLESELDTPGSMENIYILSIIGLLVLMIACINYINLTTTKSAERFKEIGVRKTIGARYHQLIAQFIGESFLYVIIAAVIAICIVDMSLNFINSLIGINIAFNFDTNLFLFMMVILIFTGLGSSIFPAIVISGFKPKNIFRNARFFQKGQNTFLRKTLVVFQLSISIMLISCTLLVFTQIKFMKNRELGININHKLILPVRGGVRLSDKYETVKSEFTSNPSIISASASSIMTGHEMNYWGTYLVRSGEEHLVNMNYIYPDQNFVELYEIGLLAGRNFYDNESVGDSTASFILNRTAINSIGISSPEKALGEIISNGMYQGEIVGVVEDFNYFGLQDRIQPLVLQFTPDRFNHLSLTVNTDDINELMGFVRNKWNELFDNHPVEPFFLDDNFNSQYYSEEKLGSLVGTFSFLAIFIAAIGLLGLISYSALIRKKELGIRKILGAPAHKILTMLTREYFYLNLIANLIAWPAAFLLVSRWLENFAYRTDVKITIFIMSGLITLFIALTTVGYRAFRAATVNPVDSIKTE